MSDFETHEIGTAKELSILRNIASSLYMLDSEEYQKLPMRTKLLVDAYIKHCEDIAYDKIGC